MSMEKFDYYVYALVDPRNGAPFYIGKGRGRRSKAHAWGCTRGVNPWKDNIIDKVAREGFEIDVVFFSNNLSEEDAFITEKVMIRMHGFKKSGGLLVNLSNGGEGQSGYHHTFETKRKISEKVRGTKNGFYGRSHSEESRLEIGAAHRGKTISEEQREEISKFQRGRKRTKEHRKRISEALKGKTKSPEHARKVGLAHKGKTISIEQRKSISQKHKGKEVSEETRRRMSEAMKLSWKRRRETQE